jgi:hypothetical protein
MAVIALPARFCPSSFSMSLFANQASFASPFGGSEQVVDRLNDRWMVSLTLPGRKPGEAAAIEAFIASLRGMANTVTLFHWARMVPRGTMRGSPTVVGQGAGNGTILINTTAGATLLGGDIIGIGGLLLQVAQDCTANGSGLMTCFLANRLRKDLANATPVIWDKPTAQFRLVSKPAVVYIPGRASEVSLDFVEAIP